jgi:hypothetical protein
MPPDAVVGSSCSTFWRHAWVPACEELIHRPTQPRLLYRDSDLGVLQTEEMDYWGVCPRSNLAPEVCGVVQEVVLDHTGCIGHSLCAVSFYIPVSLMWRMFSHVHGACLFASVVWHLQDLHVVVNLKDHQASPFA